MTRTRRFGLENRSDFPFDVPVDARRKETEVGEEESGKLVSLAGLQDEGDFLFTFFLYFVFDQVTVFLEYEVDIDIFSLQNTRLSKGSEEGLLANSEGHAIRALKWAGKVNK